MPRSSPCPRPCSRRTALRTLALLGAGIAAGSPMHAGTSLSVFVAASLGTAMTEIAREYASATGVQITVTPAGSSTLARQIARGAPADLFISANVAWMDTLQDAGLLRRESRVDLLANSLVVIGPADGSMNPQTETDPLQALDTDGRVAMALVDAVPAGIYGKAALDHLGGWDRLAPQVAQADNVRAALALVATGAADRGIVYATDAAADPRVRILARFDPAGHPPIIYPAAAMASADIARTDRLLGFLTGPAAGGVFERHGFSFLPAPS